MKVHAMLTGARLKATCSHSLTLLRHMTALNVAVQLVADTKRERKARSKKCRLLLCMLMYDY